MSDTLKSFNLKNFDPKHSLFIEASAGTGKTYTIQLMVSKLISQGTPLKKILIVTYTEKAAGELKDRIRKKINEVLEFKKINKDDSDEPELSKDVLSLFAKANQDVDNAAIFTIHSFCQKALKEYAYDAGRPFDMGMIDDAAVTTLVEQYIRDQWVNDEKFQKLLASEKTESLTNQLTETIVSAINNYKGCCKKGEIIPLDGPSLPKINGQEVPLSALEKISKATCYNDLKCIPGFEDELTFFDSVSNTEKRATEFTEKIKSWTNESQDLLFNGHSFTTKSFSETTLPHFNAIKEIKELIKSAPKHLYRAQYEEFLCKQIPILFDKWQKAKKDDKRQSFNDMILSVHKAITESDNLKEKLRQQFNFAIIDEFQDTNKLQWDIFRTIFLKDQGKAVEGHSIFVVGDPKQSIYSFQGADVNVYKEAILEINNGTSLNNNFRSTTGIIEGCNELFKGSFFTPAESSPELVKFQPSGAPTNESQVKVPPMISGKEVAPIWISENEISSLNFARSAVAKIVDWCSFENGKTKLQVFDKKDCRKYRNVSFKDFAVLARTRSEMEVMEDSLRHAGIPFSRYKDNNLFNSRECAEWIALFRALNAPDFSAWNRKLLSEVLITDFFKTVFTKKDNSSEDHSMDELHYVDSKVFDDPNNRERKLLNVWRDLALKRRYAEMLERIYSDTQIEQRLMDISKLQNLAKLRQIGNYAVEFLYSHNCSLEDLVRHLEGLAAFRDDADDEDGSLVEKGTDYDAVQVMTIHASKGLEFPVVISVAGFKGVNNLSRGPFLYHDDNGIHLGLGSDAKEIRKAEELEEWKRLFYVDFTRASSILMLPRYENWTKKDKSGAIISVKPEFKFLHDSHKEFCENAVCIENAENSVFEYPCYTILKTDSDWSIAEKKKLVREYILQPLSKNSSSAESTDNIEELIQEQKGIMEDLQKHVPQACIMQYSYSSLSGKADNGISNEDDTPIDQDGNEESSVADVAGKNKVSIKSIDVNALDCTLAYEESRDYQSHYEENLKKFPRGSKLGNAIHHVFERAKFFEIGQQLPTLESALADSKCINVVEEEFKNEALPIWNHKKEWTDIAIAYLWNTLNAKLPAIAGNCATGEFFTLTEIPLENHKAEMQFNLNAGTSEELRRFCKGFIDLMFVRTDAQGNNLYSILDWKSDVLEENRYTPEALKERVDADYSIQRVLYSYCLIQWLKQFYGEGTAENLTEEEIFNKHFGGIYYAFVRGTQGGTGKGIYAQTWKCYDDLRNAYGEIKKLMSK
ncbi:exodeoxyribonuclease V beta subunit [Fibrobacter sp. UWH9]|uniref:UvrD-helicase domain-containing protein n=1 Tax=Fibrobacter sp. UWH9 TaxID=1896213 RepID=UPI0009155090|nr:UvrD-helicase domain-containing protein [Fibrobacter sp. UWH9]SHH74222.1 exodeoxyribonuclease V beta subunit [Fibrobacter sp. UWH9]